MLCFFVLSSKAYGYTNILDTPNEYEIKNNLEEKYGINIIIVNGETLEYKNCLFVLESSLRKFPEGVIKEITDYYYKNGISTNIIVNKTEKVKDLFSEYNLTDSSANIYINALQSSLYTNLWVASEESLVHELGYFISGYVYDIYGYEKLKNEFSEFNKDLEYGNWGENYKYAFVSKDSAVDFDHEIADLIWYTESHPEYLRNINGGKEEIIHEKIKFLADVLDYSFYSVTKDTRLWLESVPEKPDEWASAQITAMKSASLIPEEFEGMYDAYISRENFYTILLDIMERKLGEENYNRSFNVSMEEKRVILDPVKGEISLSNGMRDICSDVLHFEKKERIYEACQMGFMNRNGVELVPEGYMTRMEIAKLFSYIANELGMDISDYNIVKYDDILNVDNSEKTFIYFAASKGILKGYGTNFRPYAHCTYEEAYIILLRIYNFL